MGSIIGRHIPQRSSQTALASVIYIYICDSQNQVHRQDLESRRGDPSRAIDFDHTVLRAPNSDFKILEIPQRKKIDLDSKKKLRGLHYYCDL